MTGPFYRSALPYVKTIPGKEVLETSRLIRNEAVEITWRLDSKFRLGSSGGTAAGYEPVRSLTFFWRAVERALTARLAAGFFSAAADD
jgi:hypothetical protein